MLVIILFIILFKHPAYINQKARGFSKITKYLKSKDKAGKQRSIVLMFELRPSNWHDKTPNTYKTMYIKRTTYFYNFIIIRKQRLLIFTKYILSVTYFSVQQNIDISAIIRMCFWRRCWIGSIHNAEVSGSLFIGGRGRTAGSIKLASTKKKILRF